MEARRFPFFPPCLASDVVSLLLAIQLQIILLLFIWVKEIFLIEFVFFQVANYCRDRFHTAFAEEIELVKKCLSDGSVVHSCQEQWKKTFTNCFARVDAEVGGKTNQEPVAPETVGSTAVVAIICSSHIIVANCGDSRAVLCRGKESMALSVDHKVRNFQLWFYLFIYLF